MRCSGARVLRTPSHVKDSFTAAIVVRSLWAAERSSCVVGVLVGWVVDRLAVCWPVSWCVVVAVGIWLLVSMRTDYVAVITRHSMKSGADETAENVTPQPPVPAFRPTCFAWSGSLFWWGGPFQ